MNKIVLKSWKGKDKISIKEYATEYIVTEHRKNKETNKITEINHYIPKKNVTIVSSIISSSKQDKFTYANMVEKVIKEHDFKGLNRNNFNGGLNRKIYFNFYYFPIKILEHYKKISYSSKGIITKL